MAFVNDEDPFSVAAPVGIYDELSIPIGEIE